MAQGSIHPLQLVPGLGDPFEVKSLGPIRSQQEPGAPMKELKARTGAMGKRRSIPSRSITINQKDRPTSAVCVGVVEGKWQKD